jgi:hypothetical protein
MNINSTLGNKRMSIDTPLPVCQRAMTPLLAFQTPSSCHLHSPSSCLSFQIHTGIDVREVCRASSVRGKDVTSHHSCSFCSAYFVNVNIQTITTLETFICDWYTTLSRLQLVELLLVYQTSTGQSWW